MKIHKLIEIWKEMEETIMPQEQSIEKLDGEELLNDIQYLDRCVRRAGYHFTPSEPAKEQGILQMTAVSPEGDRQIVQVKIWDNREHHIVSRFSLRRQVTDGDGCLRMELPCGSYEAEVSCGPEYTTEVLPFSIEEGKECRLTVCLGHAVRLTEEGWLAGDLHHHSVYSSPAYGGTDPVIESPEEVCRSMKSMGMQFGALSDHHNILNHEEWKQQNQNFTPIISKEISTSNGHVLSLGVEEDVIYEIPKGKDRTNEKLRSEFIRITDEIRSKGGLPQVNHPFDASFSTRYNSEFLDMIEIFQSMEIWNGATPFMEGTINGKAFHAWLEFLEEGKCLTATAGSDTHNIYGDDYFGMIEWINWLMELVINHPETYPREMKKKAEYLISLYQEVFPVFVRWVEQSDSPSTIHNYVFTGGKRTPEAIMDAIRAGRVFVTNGPLLVPTVNGAGIGERTALAQGEGKLQISLRCKAEIEHLYLYTDAGQRQELPLKETRTPEGFYDYSMSVESFAFGNAAWAVFEAESGPDCTAVTNPIYFAEK